MLEFAGNGEKAFCCAAYRVISEDGLRQLSVRNVPPKATYSDILKGNTIGCLTAFVDMQQLGRITSYNVCYTKLLRSLLRNEVSTFKTE